MKVKVVEITEIDAKIRMLRNDTGAVFMAVCALMLVIMMKVSPLEGVMVVLVAAVVFALLFTALLYMAVSSFCKSEIQTINIMAWPFKKYVLKVEAKDE